MTETEKPLDFFKFIDDTIKREEVRNKRILSLGNQQEDPLTPNQRYYQKYGGEAQDRVWFGPRRY